jgi:putative transposase
MMNTHYHDEIYPQRRDIRLHSYNYSWQGAYFVTICTHDKQSLFGNIIEGTMKLNSCGAIADSVWKAIPLHYPEVNNNVFIIMPNHIHGIIIIQNAKRAGQRPAPTKGHPLSEIVRAFKSYTSREINERSSYPGTKVWQRGYYEHVIRNEEEYTRIGDYILFNTARWETDRENPNSRVKAPALPFEY